MWLKSSEKRLGLTKIWANHWHLLNEIISMRRSKQEISYGMSEKANKNETAKTYKTNYLVMSRISFKITHVSRRVHTSITSLKPFNWCLWVCVYVCVKKKNITKQNEIKLAICTQKKNWMQNTQGQNECRKDHIKMASYDMRKYTCASLSLSHQFGILLDEQLVNWLIGIIRTMSSLPFFISDQLSGSASLYEYVYVLFCHIILV